jgi:hypothetical protein
MTETTNIQRAGLGVATLGAGYLTWCSALKSISENQAAVDKLRQAAGEATEGLRTANRYALFGLACTFGLGLITVLLGYLTFKKE